MAFSSPTQDFVVTSGLNVKGTSAVSSSTGNTSTLQVDGGAAIAKNLIVGTTSQLYGDVIVFGNLEVKGVMPYLTVTGTSNLSIVNAGITTATQLDVVTRLAVGGLSQLNNVTIANGTNATSSTTGALQVVGGVGIQKDLWVSGRAYVNGALVLTTATLNNGIPSLEVVTQFGSTTLSVISITNTSSAISTTTGALIVAGGVGIGGDLYVGGSVTATNFYGNIYPTNSSSIQVGFATTSNYALLFNTDTIVTTAINIAGGTAGQVPYQTSASVTSFYGPGTAGNVLVSNGTNSPTYNNTLTLTGTTSATSTTTGALVISGGVGIGGSIFVGSSAAIAGGVKISGITTVTNATAASSTNSGALQVVGGAGIVGALYVGGGISGNLIGGSTGALIYQSSTSTTAFLTIGSSGQLLTVVGGIPSWTSLGALSAGQANTATNLALGEAGQVPYQTSAGQTGFTAAGTAGTILTSNGTGTPTWNNTLTLAGTVQASSTASGTLQVRGGVGIGGSLYATEIYDSGNRVLTTATSIVSSIIAGTDISINTSTGNVTISDIATLQSVTNRGSTTTNIVYITNATPSTNPATGALIISGGVGISGAVNVGSTLAAVTQLSVKSNSLDPANSSTIVLSSAVPIGYSAFTIQNTGVSGQSYTFDVGGNNRALTEGTSINEGNFTLKDDTNNAYRMVITKTGNILVNTTTDTGARLQVNGSISIKSSLLETTITLINNTATTVVDSLVSSVYRSCKSLVQIQDGSIFEITEIVLLHDGAGQVYKSEYGIISTAGELGIFTSEGTIER